VWLIYSQKGDKMMIARKSIGIVLVISPLMIFGCGKDVPKEIVSEKDGAPMVLIPAGEFKMGTDASEIPQLLQWIRQWYPPAKADWFERETPLHTVYLDAFYMDKYQVTNARYAKFLNEYGKNTDSAGNKLIHIGGEHCLIEKSGGTYRPKSGYENHPVIFVTWYGATAYAQFYGKRLPTEAEWEKAARGGLVGKRYPWGDEMPPTKLVGNFADETLKKKVSSMGDARYRSVTTLMINGYDDGYAESTAPVGKFEPNGYGLFDMAGNVWEWCADEYDPGYYSESPKNNPKGPDAPVPIEKKIIEGDPDCDPTAVWCVLRGDCWHGNAYGLRCATRSRYDASVSSYNSGFRCVQALQQ